MKPLQVLLLLGLVLVPRITVGQEAPEPPAADPGENASGRRLADLEAAAQRLAADARERLGRREQEIAELTADFRQRLDEGREEARRIAGLPPFEEGRSTADELYRDLRGLVLDVLEAVGDAEERGRAARGDLATTQGEAARARLEIRRRVEAARTGGAEAPPEVFKTWRAALDRRIDALENLAELEESHRDRVFVVLKDAKALRRDFESEVSAKAVATDRGYLFEDLRAEVDLIRPNVRALARHRWRAVFGQPVRWDDWDRTRSLLVHTFWVLLVGALWLVARHQAPRAIPALLQLFVRVERYVPRDVESMSATAGRTARALVDLAAGFVLLRLLGGAVPELGLLLLIYMQVALYRLLVGLTSLAVAAYPEVRPALLTLEPAARKTLLTSVRICVGWLILRQFTRFAATRILAATALDEVLRMGFNVVLPALAIWLLHLWEPSLRDAMQRRDPAQPLVVFLSRRQLGPFRFAQSLAHLLTYLGLWVRDLLDLRTRPQAAAGDEDDDRGAELPGEVIAQLLRRECPESGYVERPAARDELDKALGRWQEERRRGVAMLLGGGGTGKRTFVDHWLKALEGGEAPVPVLRVRLKERLTTADEACDWLARALSIEEAPADPEALAGRVNTQLAGHVVILENLHLGFLRRVDGFAALRCLLSVVGAANRRLFWLLSMHRPGWHYLASLGDLVNTEACQRTIALELFSESELRDMVERRIAAAECEVTFERLLPHGSRHVAGENALERFTAEYFRRLAWESKGNPAVALRLWRETLEPGRGQRIEVTPFRQAKALPELRDSALFLLAAIHTHRSLTRSELAEVTNMSPAEVDATVRNLEAIRLLAARSKRFAIEPRYLPAVTTELRRRHVIHGSS